MDDVVFETRKERGFRVWKIPARIRRVLLSAGAGIYNISICGGKVQVFHKVLKKGKFHSLSIPAEPRRLIEAAGGGKFKVRMQKLM